MCCIMSGGISWYAITENQQRETQRKENKETLMGATVPHRAQAPKGLRTTVDIKANAPITQYEVTCG